jgi:hypothetical protein
VGYLVVIMIPLLVKNIHTSEICSVAATDTPALHSSQLQSIQKVNPITGHQGPRGGVEL